MSNEHKKEYLRGYQRAKYDLKRAEEDLEEYKTHILYPSTLFDSMPKGSGGKGDLSRYMGKLEELKKKYLKRRYKAVQKAKEIKDCIDRLEHPEEREVLVLRYIEGRKWELLAEEMDEHLTQVHRFHGRALQKLKIPEKL